jgi:hypothetical protein
MDTNVKKAIGVELSATRHKIAQQALQRLEEAEIISKGRVELFCADVTEGKYWADATVIYAACTMFRNLMPKVGKEILTNCKDFRMMIAEMREDYKIITSLFDVKCTIQLDADWGKGIQWHVYVLKK